MRRSIVGVALAAVLITARFVCGEIYITEEGDTLFEIGRKLGHTPEQLRQMTRFPSGVDGDTEFDEGYRVSYISFEDMADAGAWIEQALDNASKGDLDRYAGHLKDLEAGNICYRNPRDCRHIHWAILMRYRNQWRAGLPILPVSRPVITLVQLEGRSRKERLIQHLAALQPQFPIINPPK